MLSRINRKHRLVIILFINSMARCHICLCILTSALHLMSNAATVTHLTIMPKRYVISTTITHIPIVKVFSCVGVRWILTSLPICHGEWYETWYLSGNNILLVLHSILLLMLIVFLVSLVACVAIVISSSS